MIRALDGRNKAAPDPASQRSVNSYSLLRVRVFLVGRRPSPGTRRHVLFLGSGRTRRATSIEASSVTYELIRSRVVGNTSSCLGYSQPRPERRPTRSAVRSRGRNSFSCLFLFDKKRAHMHVPHTNLVLFTQGYERRFVRRQG